MSIVCPAKEKQKKLEVRMIEEKRESLKAFKMVKNKVVNKDLRLHIFVPPRCTSVVAVFVNFNLILMFDVRFI